MSETARNKNELWNVRFSFSEAHDISYTTAARLAAAKHVSSGNDMLTLDDWRHHYCMSGARGRAKQTYQLYKAHYLKMSLPKNDR